METLHPYYTDYQRLFSLFERSICIAKQTGGSSRQTDPETTIKSLFTITIQTIDHTHNFKFESVWNFAARTMALYEVFKRSKQIEASLVYEVKELIGQVADQEDPQLMNLQQISNAIRIFNKNISDIIKFLRANAVIYKQPKPITSNEILQNKTVTRFDAMYLLQKSEATVDKWIRAGVLRSKKDGGRGVRVYSAEIRAILEK